MQHTVSAIFPSSHLHFCSLIHCFFFLRARSIRVPTCRNTIRSVTQLVIPLSRFFRIRHFKRHPPDCCLQTQTPRWYVHLIYITFDPPPFIFSLSKNSVYIIPTNDSFQNVSYKLVKSYRRQPQTVAVKVRVPSKRL